MARDAKMTIMLAVMLVLAVVLIVGLLYQYF